MDNSVPFLPGQQVAYLPPHAEGNLSHPDVEFGFVTSVSPSGGVFCRYWRKGHLGELRTRNNSELTPLENLIRVDSVADELLEKWL